MVDKIESLSRAVWDCMYHVAFILKCLRRTLYGQLRQHFGEVFRKLASHQECRVEEGHPMPDHVHMMLSIPPKYAVSQVVWFMKRRAASTTPSSRSERLTTARAAPAAPAASACGARSSHPASAA